MKALLQAYILGRAAAISDDDKWWFSVLCRLDAEWPAWVNGPSALLEAYSLGLKGSGYRAVVESGTVAQKTSQHRDPEVKRDKEAARYQNEARRMRGNITMGGGRFKKMEPPAI